MMRARSNRRREGFALPAAIIAIVLLSALVAGALFVSTEELRSGRGDASDQRALTAAEWALDRAILAWDTQRNTAQALGSSATLVAAYAPPNDSVVVTATRVQRDAVG
jgi:Tfp pilus assembly protein PilV